MQMVRKHNPRNGMQKAGIKGDGFSTGRCYEARNLVQIGGIKREKKNPEKELAVAE